MSLQKYCGRDFRVLVNTGAEFIPLEGEQSSSISVNNEQVDTTTKTEMPWRVLTNCGLRSTTLSASGAITDGTAIQAIHTLALSGDIVEFKLVSGDGATFIGDFQVASFERSGDHNNTEMFTVTLESSGLVRIETLTYEDADSFLLIADDHVVGTNTWPDQVAATDASVSNVTNDWYKGTPDVANPTLVALGNTNAAEFITRSFAGFAPRPRTIVGLIWMGDLEYDGWSAFITKFSDLATVNATANIAEFEWERAGVANVPFPATRGQWVVIGCSWDENTDTIIRRWHDTTPLVTTETPSGSTDIFEIRPGRQLDFSGDAVFHRMWCGFNEALDEATLAEVMDSTAVNLANLLPGTIT